MYFFIGLLFIVLILWHFSDDKLNLNLSDSRTVTFLATSFCACFMVGVLYSFQNDESHPLHLDTGAIIDMPVQVETRRAVQLDDAPGYADDEIDMLRQRVSFSEEELKELKNNARFKDALKILVTALQTAAEEMTLSSDEETGYDPVQINPQNEYVEAEPEQEYVETEQEYVQPEPAFTNFKYLMDNAEFNWEWFRVARNHTTDYYEFDRFGANYPCFFGTSVIGSEGKHIDGNKWVCGFQYWNTPDCVVFSIGSNKLVGFEERVRTQNDNCEIHIFDPTVDSTDKWNNRMQKWGFDFQYVGIGNENGVIHFNKWQGNRTVLTLPSMMEKVNVDHIDVLKMDVEGWEWKFVDTDEFKEGLKKVRWQILIEVHLGTHFNVPLTKRHSSLTLLFNLLEDHGFRCYHKEPFFQKKERLNKKYPNQIGIEYSFVHKDWIPEGFIADNHLNADESFVSR